MSDASLPPVVPFAPTAPWSGAERGSADDANTLWEATTLRQPKSDATLIQTLAEGPERHPCLILYSGDDAGRRYVLDRPALLLGRSPDCDVCVDHPGISRLHAELLVDDLGVLVRDCGSANGTRVNGLRIAQPVRLADGDLLRVASIALKFYGRQSLDAVLHDRIYRMATIDAGTEVYTKRYLFEALAREIQRARRSERALSVVVLDLDHFKALNDAFGHNAGDQVLRACAETLQATLRGADVLGRTGGEEFAAVLPDTDLASACELAERMRTALEGRSHPLLPFESPARAPHVHRQTASFGVAQWHAPLADARTLLGAADRWLYAAKHAGRNCVRG